LFPQASGGGKERLVLVDGKIMRIEWTFCNSFEGMEVSKDNVGRLES
jgi:hypothetical protein